MFDLPAWLQVIIMALAVWRVSSILVYENAPFDAIARLRARIGYYVEQGAEKPIEYQTPDTSPFYEYTERTLLNSIAGVFSCVRCMSVWVAFGGLVIGAAVQPSIFLYQLFGWLVIGFALSGAAVLIDRVTSDE